MASRYHFEPEKPSLGGQIGSALGTGLGHGLSSLAQSKLDKMLAKDKHAEDKQKLVSLGIPDHEADYLAHQDPDTQWKSARQWLIAGGVPENLVPQSLDDEWNVSPEQEEQAQQQMKQALEQQGQGQLQQGLGQLGQQQPQQQMNAQPGTTAQALGQLPQSAQPQQLQQQTAIAQPKAPQRPKGLGEEFRIAETKPEKATSASKLSAKQRENSEKAIDTADEMEALLNDMEAAVETGKVATGLKGTITPTFFQNDETQQFETAANEFAGLLASKSGVATNFKIKFSQSMKPNTSQSTATQKELIKRARKKVEELKKKASLRLQGIEPEHVNKKASTGEFVSQLPISGNNVGDIATNNKTGEELTWDGNNWV